MATPAANLQAAEEGRAGDRSHISPISLSDLSGGLTASARNPMQPLQDTHGPRECSTSDQHGTEEQSPDGSLDKATGWSGLASWRAHSPEWHIYPACQRAFALALDYLSKEIYEIEEQYIALEEEEKRASQSHTQTLHPQLHPNLHYSERQKELIFKLLPKLETYSNLFTKADAIMKQPAARKQEFNQVMTWITNEDLETEAKYLRGAKHCRRLGPRGSRIDEAIQMLLVKLPKLFLANPIRTTHKCDGYSIHSFDNDGLAAAAKLIVLFLILAFLLLPLIFMYLVSIDRLAVVLLTLMFCLVFCFIIFVFAYQTTELKLMIVFAYGSIMAAFLSGLKSGGNEI